MKIVVAGVPYSPNMGDGLLADLVGRVLQAQFGTADIARIDLAGRQELHINDGLAAKSKARAAALRLHAGGPTGFLDRLYYEAKTARSGPLIRQWAQSLEGTDLLAVGPGQLISSRTANFPTKLGLLADALDQTRSRPTVVFFGVGADSGGSAQARAILRAAIARLDPTRVILRDERSARAFEELGGDADRVKVAPDLAVLTNELISDPAGAPAGSGIYVDSVDLTSYDDADGAHDVLTAYLGAVRSMIDLTGETRVVFGSNGLVEDQEFAQRLAQHCESLSHIDIEVASPPSSPTEIAERAGRHVGTVGVRLHAVLPALALGRPIVAPVLTAKAAGVIDSAYNCNSQEHVVLSAPAVQRHQAAESVREAAQWLHAA